MNLPALFEHAADFAAYTFSKVGRVVPQWIALDEEENLITVMTPWVSAAEKEATVEGMKEVFKARKVIRYALIVEAWATMHQIHNKPKREDRREVVMVNAEDISGEIRFGTREIIRHPSRPPKLGPLTMSEVGWNHEGLFVALLTPDIKH